jgi:hypothetical protein
LFFSRKLDSSFMKEKEGQISTELVSCGTGWLVAAGCVALRLINPNA